MDNNCAYAALRRMNRFIMTAKNTTVYVDPRLDAPLVYPDSSCSGGWIVRPVEGSEKVELVTFSGPNACQAALEFAHAKYGCARHFSA